MTPAKRLPAVIASLFALDAIVVALYLVVRLTGPWPRGVSQFFDLNREGNLPTWFSSMQWLCVAAVLGAFAWRLVSRAEGGGRPLLALAFLFLCMSLDEVAQIHERLGLRTDRLLPSGTRVGGVFPHTGIWMFVIGIPVLLLFVVAIRSASARLRRAPGAFARIAIGLGLTAVGAMFFDLIGNLMYYRRGSPFPALEESLELLGATVVLWGSLDLLRAHGLCFGVHGVADAEERGGSRPVQRSAA
jgi:hypothetical protein